MFYCISTCMSRTSFCEFVYIFVFWLYAFYQFCTQFITYIFILPKKCFQGNMFSVITNCNKMKLCCPFKTSNTRQYLKNAIYTPFKVNLKPSAYIYSGVSFNKDIILGACRTFSLRHQFRHAWRHSTSFKSIGVRNQPFKTRLVSDNLLHRNGFVNKKKWENKTQDEKMERKL